VGRSTEKANPFRCRLSMQRYRISVQLGGIFTPPEHRGHGYARAAVAASLIAASQRGAFRAVLFTSNPSGGTKL